jgi:hypothetical protein
MRPVLQFSSLCLVAAALFGCTSIDVQPVAKELGVQHVCIQDNQRGGVYDFLIVLTDGFARHGITTEVFYGAPPERCEYVLTYKTTMGWDVMLYLNQVDLRIDHQGQKVASGTYHLIGSGGISSIKWNPTKDKVDPLIDELLVNYSIARP